MKRSRTAAIALIAACAGCASPEPSRSLAQGERLYRNCHSCHSLEVGDNSPAGPTLHAIVDRPVASQAGFNYSPALRRLARTQPTWSRELLDRFLADPDGLAPGTEMGFVGLDDLAERRALIAWLEAEADRRP